MPKRLPYRVEESHLIYQGHIIRLVKDRFYLDVAPGKLVTRELVHHPGAVVIIPVVNKTKILLIRQFRYAAQGDLWEIPAGTREIKEKPLVCAKRELEEETGFKARKWTFLTQFYPAPGICNEIMTMFKAETLVKGRKNLDHDEWIEHQEVTLSKAYRMIRKGEIQDGKTILGLLWLSHFSGQR